MLVIHLDIVFYFKIMSGRGVAGPNSSKAVLQEAIRGLQKPVCWYRVGAEPDFLRSLWSCALPRRPRGKDGPVLWVATLPSLWWKHTWFAPDVPEAVG